MALPEDYEARLRRLVEPVTTTEDPWPRLHGLLNELRRENMSKGGDDATLAQFLAICLAQFTSIPVQGGAGE